MSLIPFVITKKSVILVTGSEGPQPILLIKAGGINLPYGIGAYDSQLIMALVAGDEPSEESPHDLTRNILVALGASITKIAIAEISDENFFAKIFFSRCEEEFSLPAFAVDAIILGLSFNAPMFVEEQLLIDATSGEGTQEFLSIIYEHDPEILES